MLKRFTRVFLAMFIAVMSCLTLPAKAEDDYFIQADEYVSTAAQDYTYLFHVTYGEGVSDTKTSWEIADWTDKVGGTDTPPQMRLTVDPYDSRYAVIWITGDNKEDYSSVVIAAVNELDPSLKAFFTMTFTDEEPSPDLFKMQVSYSDNEIEDWTQSIFDVEDRIEIKIGGSYTLYFTAQSDKVCPRFPDSIDDLFLNMPILAKDPDPKGGIGGIWVTGEIAGGTYIPITGVKAGTETVTVYGRDITVVVTETPISKFVDRLYELCLTREPDESGMLDWTSWLKTGKLSAAQVVQGFFESNEMKEMGLSPEEFIDRCYEVMMDRVGDEEGRQTWVDAMKAGVSNKFILRGFIGSSEFKQICADTGITVGDIKLTEGRDRNLGITKFVSRCYSEVLGRSGEADGLNMWCDLILNDPKKKEKAIWVASEGFFHSPEYIGKHTSNEQYIRTLYKTFLGREAEDAGYQFWADQMAKGMSRDEVMKGFAYSSEFAAIMETYGIK